MTCRHPPPDIKQSSEFDDDNISPSVNRRTQDKQHELNRTSDNGSLNNTKSKEKHDERKVDIIMQETNQEPWADIEQIERLCVIKAQHLKDYEDFIGCIPITQDPEPTQVEAKIRNSTDTFLRYFDISPLLT